VAVGGPFNWEVDERNYEENGIGWYDVVWRDMEWNIVVVGWIQILATGWMGDGEDREREPKKEEREKQMRTGVMANIM